MRVLEKKTKGFTILELIVVIAILGILSAAVYPNFSSWIKAREVKQEAIKIKNLISSINTQVQRGSYEFVQVRFIEDGSVKIFTSGIGTISLALEKKLPTPTGRFNDPDKRCNVDDSYWDDVGGNPDASGGVRHFTSKDIVVNFVSDTYAVCFSKDGSYYSESGLSSPLHVCLRTREVFRCSAKSDGDPDTDLLDGVENYIYRIKWSRFGNVTMDKWNNENDKWIPHS